MKKKELFNNIKDLFGKYNCAQTVLMATADYFKMDNDFLKDIAAPFGGGLSGIRFSVCGAISGGLMFIGLKEDKNKSEAGKKLIKFVEDKYGFINCNEILDIDFDDKEQVLKEKEPKGKTICLPLINDICEWLVDRYSE